MIQIPTVKPSVVKGLESDFGTSVAVSIWRKTINNHQWVERAFPVGAILFFHEDIKETGGVPKDLPNPDIWAFCDGSLISDPDSPLDGQNTPNMLDLFLRGSDVEQALGGNPTVDVAHAHGGGTGFTDDRADQVADTGGDHPTGTNHNHSLSTEWSSAEPIIPKYNALQCYIRYK